MYIRLSITNHAIIRFFSSDKDDNSDITLYRENLFGILLIVSIILSWCTRSLRQWVACAVMTNKTNRIHHIRGLVAELSVTNVACPTCPGLQFQGGNFDNRAA